MKLLEQSQIRRISDVLSDEPGTLVKSTNPLEISSDVIRVLRRISRKEQRLFISSQCPYIHLLRLRHFYPDSFRGA